MRLLPIFLLVLAFLLWARVRNKAALFFGWAFLVTAVPPMRGQLGPIPIYTYDVAVVLVWTVVLRRSGTAWFAGTSGWLMSFLVVLGLFGTLVPMIRYGGFFPEMLWNFGHTSLAFTTLALGAFLVEGATERERKGFRNGLLAGIVVMATIAVLQTSNPALNSLFVELFTGGNTEADDMVAQAVLIAEALSSGGRVAGAFGSPNTLAVAAIFIALNIWIIGVADRRRGISNTVVLASMVIIILASGSRQALIAAAAIATGFVALAPLRKSLPGLLIGGAVIVLATATIDADVIMGRLARLSEGSEEVNVAARLSDGPQRLLYMLDWDPSLFFTGVGLEIGKFPRLGIDVSAEIIYGFVSNGYLLYLYYFGCVGFLIMTSFWIWVAWKGASAPKIYRPVTLGAGLAQSFLVFVDNHAVLAEELVTQMMVFVGLLIAVSGPQAASVGRWAQPHFKREPDAHRSG